MRGHVLHPALNVFFFFSVIKLVYNIFIFRLKVIKLLILPRFLNVNSALQITNNFWEGFGITFRL